MRQERAWRDHLQLQGGAHFKNSAIDGHPVKLRTGGVEPAELEASLVVNATGLDAWDFSSRVSGLDTATIPARYLAKGSYFGLTGKAPFRHLIYPVPEPGGLGIHLTLDLAGQARFGPDVEWVDRIRRCRSTARPIILCLDPPLLARASRRRVDAGLFRNQGEDDSSRSRARRFCHPGSERNLPSGLHRAAQEHEAG